MTARDFERDKRRRQTGTARSDDEARRVASDWRRVRSAEQSWYEQIARAHRDTSGFCDDVACQIERGRQVTQKQAAVLMQIEEERRLAVAR
jgi:hypothetical protein